MISKLNLSVVLLNTLRFIVTSGRKRVKLQPCPPPEIQQSEFGSEISALPPCPPCLRESPTDLPRPRKDLTEAQGHRDEEIRNQKLALTIPSLSLRVPRASVRVQRSAPSRKDLTEAQSHRDEEIRIQKLALTIPRLSLRVPRASVRVQRSPPIFGFSPLPVTLDRLDA